GLDRDETWTLSRGGWSMVPSPELGNRSTSALAFDAARQQIVMFGGASNVGPPLDDTWAYDPGSWSQHVPAASPPRLTGHVMAFDAARGSTVLFGGHDGSAAVRDDTWTWTGTNWQATAPAHKPTARSNAAMGCDPIRRQIVLFGGSDDVDALGDTW